MVAHRERDGSESVGPMGVDMRRLQLEELEGTYFDHCLLPVATAEDWDSMGT